MHIEMFLLSIKQLNSNNNNNIHTELHCEDFMYFK